MTVRSSRKWTRVLAGLAVVCIVAVSDVSAAEPKGPAKEPAKKPAKEPRPPKPVYKVFLEPDQAGPEFKVQGEYVGAAGDAKIGVQVIALGEGRFQAVFLAGGLPGDGWDGKSKVCVDGRLEGDKTVFAPSKAKKKYMGRSPDEFSAVQDNPSEGQKAYSAAIAGDALTGKTDGGQAIRAKKIVRGSPTIGAKPPAGAIVLFDGTSAKEFNDGKVDERGLLVCSAETKRTFGSFTMHLEFRTPFKPQDRSQGRGNSGVYIQRRYEVQVLDSFGLEGMTNECGGLYRQKTPDVNMCLPPLTWQTYDIDFTAATFEDGKKVKGAVITVRHNGVVIHDKYELKNKTGAGRAEGSEPGPIWLQGHGNPVFFRNIWLVEK